MGLLYLPQIRSEIRVRQQNVTILLSLIPKVNYSDYLVVIKANKVGVKPDRQPLLTRFPTPPLGTIIRIEQDTICYSQSVYNFFCSMNDLFHKSF